MVYTGGPMQSERGFVIHADDSSWQSSLKVTEGLTVTTSRDILAAMASGDGPAKALVALGYAGLV